MANVKISVDLADVVWQEGPHAIEMVKCLHCQSVHIYVHPFVESLTCYECGKRNPSAIPIYSEKSLGMQDA